MKRQTKEKIYVNKGGLIRILCEANKGQPLPTFTWTHQGKILRNNANITITDVLKDNGTTLSRFFKF